MHTPSFPSSVHPASPDNRREVRVSGDPYASQFQLLVVRPGGWFVTEIGYSIEDKTKQLLNNWEDIRTTADLQGIPRVIAARKPEAKQSATMKVAQM